MKGKKIRNTGMVLVAVLWLGLALWAWLRPSDALSEAERRKLARFPAFSGENLLSGKFMSEFETYSLDQFPLRDGFRQLKARVHYQLLGRKDNNGIYLAEGQAAKLEYPLNEDSLRRALGIFQNMRDKYLSGSAVFVSVIPDKGYYLAEKHGYPAMDYDTLVERMRNGMPYASYVNLLDCLSAEDYYRTDTHWRQERLFFTAGRLSDALGIPAPEASDFRVTEVDRPFYGVYYGQAALPMESEPLYLLENEMLDSCTVYNYETGKTGGIYDRGKLDGSDLYEVFLSGPVSLLKIENPNALTDRELILFRDSFGSSLAPLLVQGYQTVTLIDIRYLSSMMLDRFVDFHGQDVLFLYSAPVLNHSTSLQG